MATDFEHLVGQKGQETNLNFLRREVVRLTGENQRLSNELMTRALPTLTNLSDSLHGMIQAASTGNEFALNNLRILLDNLEQARRVVDTKGKIVVAR